jgi:hypothetical protein
MIAKKRSIRLQVEALEGRCVPAGNMTTQLVAPGRPGNYELLLQGDNSANQVRLIHVSAREVQIVGQEGTLIDGETAKTIVLPNETDVISALNIDTGNGDDSVTQHVEGAFEFMRTDINTGLGDDAVEVIANRINSLFVDTAAGNDRVVLSAAANSPVQWFSFNLDTGLGNDYVLIQTNADDPSAAELLFHFDVDTGWGDDVVRFDGTFLVDVGADFHVSLGGGNDTLIGDSSRAAFQLANAFAFIADGGDGGHDAVLNSAFFSNALVPFFDFEEIA